MVAVLVGVDVLLFKGRPWERLAANVGTVLVFGAFYFRFMHHIGAADLRLLSGHSGTLAQARS